MIATAKPQQMQPLSIFGVPVDDKDVEHMFLALAWFDARQMLSRGLVDAKDGALFLELVAHPQVAHMLSGCCHAQALADRLTRIFTCGEVSDDERRALRDLCRAWRSAWHTYPRVKTRIDDTLILGHRSEVAREVSPS